MDTITIPTAADMHIHLRQGTMMQMVTPYVPEGGVSICYVMPNLQPTISNTEMAIAYKAELEALAPKVTFLMSLYLNPGLTPDEIRKAAKAGVRGNNVCVMNAEEKFLGHLKDIHLAFPKLKIILEHATTAAAVAMVKSLGDTVGCTITVHHLQLVVDDWAGKCHNFCKPVAKYPSDRAALRNVVKEGVFTTPLVLPYLATILESYGALDRLQGFACDFGRAFYEVKNEKWVGQVKLVREDWNTPAKYAFGGAGLEGEQGDVVPFMAGKPLGWKIASVV
ncbi:hypothetical protein BG004_006263 [Podila humilis]|nr:hypothetical protein BG004_006263 [Podila humilis]